MNILNFVCVLLLVLNLKLCHEYTAADTHESQASLVILMAGSHDGGHSKIVK